MFDFWLYKNASHKKRFFVYECNLKWRPITGRQLARFYLLKGKKSKVYVFIKAIHFVKIKTICVKLYFKTNRHFLLRDCSWKFWNWHLNTNSMTLCVTSGFNKQKIWHFAKSKTILVTVFYIQKSWQFLLSNFHGTFEISVV